MYLEFFKLQSMPFRLAPDPRFLYRSAGHSAALAGMQTAEATPNSCIVLVANKGLGKTTLLEHIFNVRDGVRRVRLAFPPPTIQELSALLVHPDEPPPPGPLAVLCDNAHLFPPKMLAALVQRSLLPPERLFDMRLVLAGEPGLQRNVDIAARARPHRRSIDSIELPILTAEEVRAYIAHRLAMAGSQDTRIFSDEICGEVHRETRGNPRMINALCDAAMMLACERELRHVGMAEILRGLEDIAALATAHAARPQTIEPAESEVPASDPTPEPPIDSTEASFGRLKLLHQGVLQLERDLPRGILRVGRGTENELRIDGKYVSRYHCRIVTTERMCLLEDVRSTNGLYVNEQRVKHHRLRNGDAIQLGEHELRYEDYREGKPDFD
jgi:general secretion pathway protein A